MIRTKPLLCLILPGLLAIVSPALGNPSTGDSSLTLRLDPSGGAISGRPGVAIGWGFTVTNTNATYSVVIAGSDFCPGSVIASPCPGAGETSVGKYTDKMGDGKSFRLKPGEKRTEKVNGSGIFKVDSKAPPVTSVGVVVVYYFLIDRSNQFIGSYQVTADASVTVLH